MKINYYLLAIFKVQANSNTEKQNKLPPHNNRPKWLLLKASSYLSIGHCIISNDPTFIQISINIKITKKKVRVQKIAPLKFTQNVNSRINYIITILY